jgi:hypothetical protein
MNSDPLQNATLHISEWNLARMDEFRLKYSTSRHFSHEMATSDFFLCERLKRELISLPVAEINELFLLAKAILGFFAIETITSTFSKEIERLKQVINMNNDHFLHRPQQMQKHCSPPALDRLR